MNLILVIYNLKVGGEKFLKQIYVQHKPLKGEYLKVCNTSFIVVEAEQDIDSYMEGLGLSCESVSAILNEECHDERDYKNIKKSLISTSWKKY